MSSPEKISPKHIEFAFEDIDLLQQNLTLEEKKEILSKVVERIVVSCISRKVNCVREMGLSIFPKSEFSKVVPKCDIRFIIDASCGRSVWRIASPFKLDCSTVKNYVSPAKERRTRHFISEIMKWRREIAENNYSIREFAKLRKMKPSIVCAKLSLLKRLSIEAQSEISTPLNREEISRLSLRKLIKISKLEKARQLPEIMRILKRN